MGKATTKPPVIATANDRAPNTPPSTIADNDLARRAYGLYLSRGCQHGHDLDDWLQAERELIQSPSFRSA